MNTHTSVIQEAERLLAVAGITTTSVEGCNDDQSCPWCDPDQMPLAA